MKSKQIIVNYGAMILSLGFGETINHTFRILDLCRIGPHYFCLCSVHLEYTGVLPVLGYRLKVGNLILVYHTENSYTLLFNSNYIKLNSLLNFCLYSP